MLLNFGTRELYCKIVYYGAGRAGKTTNLEVIHRQVPPPRRSRLVKLDTDTECTLYFDFMPLTLGTLAGLTVKLQLYTVPGQIHYRASRQLILRKADGVVFVVDSQRERFEANAESLEDLEDGMRDNHLDPDITPRLIQYNKRDLPSAMSLDDLRRELNAQGRPEMPAVAQQGFGVQDTLREITRMTLQHIRRTLGEPAGASDVA